jgi:hypothetical protein
MSMVMVTAMATSMIAMINPCLFCQSNGTMAAVINFCFIFDKNTLENLCATKVIVGER